MLYIKTVIQFISIWYVNQVSKRKVFKSRYFASIVLKSNSPLNLALKQILLRDI